MGKKATFGNNITLTPDECDTLKRYAVNGIIANADNKRLKEKLASAEKTVSIWKQRYEAVNEKYMELKQKAQPFLDALEIASERVRAFISAILARGKETRELKTPAASVDRIWNFDGGIAYSKKYYEEAKYNAAFDRCVDVMTQLLQKYGHQVLDKLEQDAPQTVESSKDDKQAQPLTDKAA